MRKLSAKCVPKMLTPEWKLKKVDISKTIPTLCLPLGKTTFLDYPV